MQPSQEYLRANFGYEPTTGRFWRFLDGFVGKASGRGYRQVRTCGRTYFEHRLVWIHANGAIPTGLVIDHINGDTLDNRIENLRVVTHSENARGHRRTRTCGSKGVTYYPNAIFGSQYVASATVNKVNRYGYFATEAEAAAAYIAFKQSQ